MHHVLPFTPSSTQSVEVPKPLGYDKNLFLLDGRSIEVAFRSTVRPFITVYDNVLSEYECQCLVSESKKKLEKSTVVSGKDGQSEFNPARTSSGTYFSKDDPIVEAIEQRLAKLANWPMELGEDIQVMRYLEGEEYKPHFDYFDPKLEGSKPHIQDGNRVATMIMYLNNFEAGGSTHFPEVGAHVVPKVGRVVFFSYDIATPESKSLHSGTPVISGQKWIATKWWRERK